MAKKISESILQKRIKRFKSMKRGYYSLVIIISLYLISLLGPLWMNNKPLFVKYDNKYYFPAIMDFIDFIPGVNYPLYEAKTFTKKINSIEVDFRLLDRQVKKENPIATIDTKTIDYRGPQDVNYLGPQNVNYTGYNFDLKKNTQWINQFYKNDDKNFILMPIYPYHPHEDLKDELDEIYTDLNNNGVYNIGEPYIDENNDGIWNENYPPTLPDGFGGRYLLGTDNTGRDVFTRTIMGGRTALTITFFGSLIALLWGGLLRSRPPVDHRYG